MRIRAAVLSEMGAKPPFAKSRPLQIEELELAEPGREEVLVAIHAAGLCHSDLSVIEGNRPRQMPMVLGHEAAGVVVRTGEGVSDLRPGDHVVLVFMPSCGSCLPCAQGRPALCEPGAAANAKGSLLANTFKLQRPKTKTQIYHHLGCSSFADHAVVSRRSVIKIDKTVPLTQAALFGCAVLTGVGAVVNTAAVKPGQSVAIIGLGGVGLAAVLGAIASGAGKIVAVDIDESKLAQAREMGASYAINAARPEWIEQVRELTSGGVDVALEFAGVASALENAWKITRRGGLTVSAGLPPPNAELSINIVSLVGEERTLKGSYIGTSVPMRDVPRYLELFGQGRLPVDRLLSGVLSLDEINEGFDLLQQGKVARLLIEFKHA
jgi:alcohol dehydrogenase